MAKKTDYKNKDQRELGKLLKERKEALSTFRFHLAGSKVRNLKEGRAIRKDIARIMTELNRKPQIANK